MKKMLSLILVLTFILPLFGCSSDHGKPYVLYKADGYRHGKKIADIYYKNNRDIDVFISMLNDHGKEYAVDKNDTAEGTLGEPDYILEFLFAGDNADDRMDIYLWLDFEHVVFQNGEYSDGGTDYDRKFYVSSEKDYHGFMNLLQRHQ